MTKSGANGLTKSVALFWVIPVPRRLRTGRGGAKGAAWSRDGADGGAEVIYAFHEATYASGRPLEDHLQYFGLPPRRSTIRIDILQGSETNFRSLIHAKSAEYIIAALSAHLSY